MLHTVGPCLSLDHGWCCHIGVIFLECFKRWWFTQALHMQLRVACLIHLHHRAWHLQHALCKQGLCVPKSTETKATFRASPQQAACMHIPRQELIFKQHKLTWWRLACGRKGLACAGPACWKPLCSNQSAVRVVSKTSLSTF